MRIVLDTNVFVSGVFFTGPPYRIVRAWQEGRLQIVYSAAIREEYEQVLEELGRRFSHSNAVPLLRFLDAYGELVKPTRQCEVVCRDPDDEKFIACYLDADADWIVSGDRDLLELEHCAVRVLSPRAFLDRFL